ncbi:MULTISPECIES: type II toxin-antitoxin system Phd/YefM family antitoxin [Xanthomonas]|uniref:type II toxin-antitoxin system Phd/YefM family antitoxin n=1 Tax=Xanthomonas TaxID=338 RepID=UPI001ADC5E12|nr:MULTISPECIES: type II toxin-antitoxin system prevent-host-death family antitoxin [unclassified Xanthomonas]MBO9875087.1 type II toxin-antitoxin system prevent-host-death family antitoxin [Xanthomonas sp. D-93]WNH45817.1 type II toxin-antitoxin system prevent-host-death family antitoxin [Xanthomonas sp. A6251]
MDTITYSIAHASLADIMDRVINKHEPVIIRYSEQAVVMLSLENYKAMEETASLLRSPKNAQRLLESIAQLESGCDKARKQSE